MWLTSTRSYCAKTRNGNRTLSLNRKMTSLAKALLTITYTVDTDNDIADIDDQTERLRLYDERTGQPRIYDPEQRSGG
jgi:hypothetical protein